MRIPYLSTALFRLLRPEVVEPATYLSNFRSTALEVLVNISVKLYTKVFALDLPNCRS